MLYDRKQLPELNYMKHRHDDDSDNYVDYEKMILDRSLTPYIYNNDIMFGYLKRLQPLISILFDHFNVVKNFKNYMVDKYYYKNKG